MSKLFKILPIFLLVFGASGIMVEAKTKGEKTSAAVTNLRKTSKKYRNSKLVKIETEKKVTSELLGRTTKYVGQIFLSQGKFRWENDHPEKTLLLFDGDIIWNVQYPPEDLGGPVQVAKAKLDKNTKSQILISTLIGRDPIDKNFKIIDENLEKDALTVKLEPLAGDLRVKDLTLEVDVKKTQIKKVTYRDDVDNLTEIEFKKTEFISKEKKELFKYSIPKDAQVTNL